MLNDKRDYPEPHKFKPERFLKNGKLDSSVREPMSIAFGLGRRWALLFYSFALVHVSPSSNIIAAGPTRICPGKHIAHSTLKLAAASVLSTFDLIRKVDENGREFVPKGEYRSAAIRRVHFQSWLATFLTFKCHLKSTTRLSMRDQAKVSIYCRADPLFLWAWVALFSSV